MSNATKAAVAAWTHLLWFVLIIGSLPLLFLISWWHWFALFIAGITLLSWIVFRGKCLWLELEKGYRGKDAFTENSFIEHYSQTLLGIHIPRAVVAISGTLYMIILLTVALSQISN